MPHRLATTQPAPWLLVILFSLAGCAQLPANLPRPATSLAERAATESARDNHSQAANLYRQAADTASEPKRSRLYLKVAQAHVRAKDAQQAMAALDQVDSRQLDAQSDAELQLTQIEARIIDQPPASALRMLPPPGGGAPPDIAARIWGLRADLLFADQQIVEGIHALVQRDVWLLDPEQIKDNDYRIWETLGRHPEADKSRQALANTDAITRGWVSLAQIARRVWPDRQALENELARWEQRHPGHPAGRNILPDRFDYAPTVPGVRSGGIGTNIIGLALPLSGSFAGAAEAVHDGFMAAYYDSDAPRPRLRIYDSAVIPDMTRLLEQARADGLGLLVGPLAKNRVTQLTQIPNPGLPILALNYSETGDRFPGFYQFGLAPEDEARAVARRALRQGMTQALALVPDDDWGNRMLDAFRAALNAEGGELVDYATYNPDKQDHADPIKRVLDYNSRSTGQSVKASEKPVSPSGGEFLFLAARPEQGRLIRSQLRFYRATDLPVLATSHVFTGKLNPGLDSDLNDVLFADMPWILGDSSEIADRRQRLEQIWPDANNRYPRLFAMGYDAGLLAQRLRQTQMTSGDLLKGSTGELFLEPDGQIRRRLDWGRFVKGRPRPVDDPPERYELSY